MRGQSGKNAGTPARAKAAISREVTLGTVAEATGIQHVWEHSRPRSDIGAGVTGHRGVPSHHHIPPTVIHLGAGKGAALARPSKAWARASKAGERERRAVQQDIIRVGGSGGHGWWAPERFRSKEAVVGPACGYTVPTQHCGPGAGAERAHSGLGDTVCPNRSAPGSGMADRTAPGEPRAQGKARLGKAGGAE